MQYDMECTDEYIFAASFAGVYGETAAVFFKRHVYEVRCQGCIIVVSPHILQHRSCSE